MRIIADARRCVRNANRLEEFDRARFCLAPGRTTVDDERLRNLVADREHRVQGGHRLLKNEPDLGAANRLHLAFGQRQQIASVQQNPP